MWGSKHDVFPPIRQAHHAVLPTKTSLECIQFACNSFSFLSAGPHVSSISFIKVLFLLIFVAVTLSMVSCSLIAWYHLILISSSDSGFPCITLSHLRSHIKYTDSDRRIWRSRVSPWCVVFFCCCRWCPLGRLSDCRLMHPHPRIVPRVISGHGKFLCSHRFLASCHIISVCVCTAVVPHLHCSGWLACLLVVLSVGY